MPKNPVSRSMAVLLAMIAILAISLMAMSTANTTLMAAEPEGQGDTPAEIEAEAFAATAVYTGHIDAHTETQCFYDTTEITLYRIATLTTTVNATLPAGRYELRSDLALTKVLTIEVEFSDGVPTTSTQITLSGQENIDTQLETTSTSFFLESTDSPWLSGNINFIGHTGCVTISHATEGFSGADPASIYALNKQNVYLPIVEKQQGPTPTPRPTNYYDDFSNPNSGWPRGQFGHCSYDYYYDYRYDNWYYRIEADNHERCVIPAPSWATQTNGTFEVMASRPGYAPGMYGFLFRAGADADRNRWGLEVRPDRIACGDKPFYWLSYINNGKSKLLNPGVASCTNDVYTGRSSWNKLKAVSNGDTVWVYLNDRLQMSGSGGPDASQYKYFDLEAIANSNVAVTVYFDWVKFTPN